MLLWEEYCAQVSDEHRPEAPVKAWSYSEFCENYRQFARTLKRSVRQTHRAGEKLFIDFAGPTIALADGSRANIFVAAMGASGYCYALATPAQTALDWLTATASALAFYGGVSQLIVFNFVPGNKIELLWRRRLCGQPGGRKPPSGSQLIVDGGHIIQEPEPKIDLPSQHGMEIVMLERYFVRPVTVDRIRANVAGAYIEHYVRWLHAQGYSDRNVFRRVPILCQFGDFASRHRATDGWTALEQVEPFVRH